jgi:transcriptional regulator of acetoin/glycerol metabolism
METRSSTTIDEQAALSSRQTPTARYLVWVHGEATPQAIGLDGATVSVGREPRCEVRLASARVSRRHLEIVPSGSVPVARDLGSRNGTRVDGVPIEQCPLSPGNVLRVADCIAVVVCGPMQITSWELEDLGDGLFAGPELALQLRELQRVASSDLPITVVGATGTGKERVARALHQWSGRGGPFHAVNCAALPANLVEAELFGYRKGAFTGAAHAHRGQFREAEGGTLFLDEIADLSREAQAKLLRVVEDRQVRPLGETRSYPVNTRLVVATQRPFETLVAAGTFRDDLAARLAGLVVEISRLALRRADILPLFRRFVGKDLGKVPELAPELAEALLLHGWPGNVRELELTARRLAAVHGAKRVWVRAMLPSHMLAHCPTLLPPVGATPTSVKTLRAAKANAKIDVDVSKLVTALDKTCGNVSAAAAVLGMSRQRAYRLLARHSSAPTLPPPGEPRPSSRREPVDG